MSRVACPGSFDPVTNGHVDVFRRASRLFDEVAVVISVNSGKSGWFGLEERLELIRLSTSDLPNVEVDTFGGLLVDYCTAAGIAVILKGVRAVSDFDYEVQMAQMNRDLAGVETVLLPAGPSYGFLSSSLIKEVATFGGDVSGLVPAPVLAAMNEKLAARRAGEQ